MDSSEVSVRLNEVAPDMYKPHIFLFGELLQIILEAKKGTPFTYGATPLDQMQTLESQEQVHNELQKLTYKVSDSIPLEVVSYVHDTFSRRFFGRGEANNENFMTRLVRDYQDLDPILVAMIDRGRTGDASPAELILIRDLLGIRSVELACLTHPYGEKIELRDEMREVVRQAVEVYGGEYFEEPETRFRIKDIVGSEDQIPGEFGTSPALLMTRKRTVGILPDGTHVRERSSFVLRIDEASYLYQLLGPDVIEELRHIYGLEGNEQEEALKAFKPIIEDLLSSDGTFDEAIPISTTIYAFNDETAELVDTEVQRRKAEDEQFLHDSNPEDLALVDDTWLQEWNMQQDIERERQLAVDREARERRERLEQLRILKEESIPVYNKPDAED